MRKGVSPIIAVILLLLITISMIGFAFVWFGDIFQQLTQTTENQTIQQITKTAQTIKIDNVGTHSGNNATIFIRNTGSAKIPTDKISVYTDNQLRTCYNSSNITNNTWKGNLALGKVKPCYINDTCGKVKVTAPGNEDVRNC